MSDLRSYSDPVELAKSAAGDWLRELAGRKTADAPPPYLVALSGGRVTKTFFDEIIRQIKESAIVNRDIFEAANLHFFWADERYVPPTDPESNYAMAREFLFEPWQIPEERIHRVRCEADEAAALQEVTGELGALRPFPAGGQPSFDMIFLGMGEDGHVASLFPGESEETMAGPAVYRAVTAIKPPPRRVTLGYGVITAAKKCWVLASGAGKEGALKESLASNGKTPLARVLRMRSNTRVYTDIAAPVGSPPGTKKV